MKNLIALARPADIEQYVASQLQTEEFRASVEDPCGYMRHWISRFAQIPRVFFEMSHPDLEHPHFYPWFGAFMRRTYDNPYVHDLFWLHEMAHAVALSYDERLGFDAWLDKMVDNELRVALESEVLVYFEMPGLRAKTFPFEIWADRYLSRPLLDRRRIFIERRRAMNDPADAIEVQMATYPTQNRVWGSIWRARFPEVERAMRLLIEGAETDRQAALARHLDWLQHETGMTADLPIPFPDEATQFATVFWGNKARGTTQETGSHDGDWRLIGSGIEG